VRKVRFVPPSSTDASAPIVTAAEEAATAVLGEPVRAAGFTATCDMTYLVNHAKIPTIILGPDGIERAHQANECISIEQMALAVEVYLKTIEAWARRA
jgi:succinyl-diaminopimelate desuccinylase